MGPDVTTEALSSVVKIRRSFAKSANVERDAGHFDFDTYRVTGRVLDLLWLISKAMIDKSVGRAISITGPYGAGKSSFALFLQALLERDNVSSFVNAIEKVREADFLLAESWEAGLDVFSHPAGSVKTAFGTANVEPLTVTLGRLLPSRSEGRSSRDLSQIEAAGDFALRVESEARRQPMAILIDEFGKNLEQVGRHGSEADPFVLQELAERSAGLNAAPFFIITMQHSSYGEYVENASSVQRREWAKVQGRFHDVSFVETAEQSRALAAQAFEPLPESFAARVTKFFTALFKKYSSTGLVADLRQAGASYPLHPVTLQVLPELCNRYGQNERTLFSFLGGAEADALPALIDRMLIPSEGSLPLVGLDSLYDFFLSSSRTSLGASTSASRWLEVETRIRDSVGLSGIELVALKNIAVLNLVASAGTLRASRQLVTYLLSDLGLASSTVEESLESLMRQGLLTYRESSDEYRLWNGSDFDIASSVALGRQLYEGMSLGDLMSQTAHLGKIVAGRASQETGLLRVFDNFFCGSLDEIEKHSKSAEALIDGHCIYWTSTAPPPEMHAETTHALIIAVPKELNHLHEDALELVAHQFALNEVAKVSADWVARKEIAERLAGLQYRLAERVSRIWSARTAEWYLLEPRGQMKRLDSASSISGILSLACDAVYSASPIVRNEMIVRRELTSQGAKARRFLIEAMFRSPSQAAFGIEGFGPERAIYEALLSATGIHKKRKNSQNPTLGEPSARDWKPLWRSIEKQIRGASNSRISVPAAYDALLSAPFGIRPPLAIFLFVCVLKAHEADVAVYEYGNLVLEIDDAVLERLVKNPDVFGVKYVGASTGARKEFLDAIGHRWDVPESKRVSFLTIAKILYREVRAIAPYSQRTESGLSQDAKKIRQIFLTANEPDLLLFSQIPKALGFGAVDSRSATFPSLQAASALADIVIELRKCYASLLTRCLSVISSAFEVPGSLLELRMDLVSTCSSLKAIPQSPDTGALIEAVNRTHLEDEKWLENLCMVVSGGTPLRNWADDDEKVFPAKARHAANRLKEFESLSFFESDASISNSASSVLIAMTLPSGSRFEQVVSPLEDDGALAEIQKLLSSNGLDSTQTRLELAAWLLHGVSGLGDTESEER
jgi:hypothetical protein